MKISTLFATDEPIGRGHDVCKSLNQLLEQQPEHPLAIPILIENATYYISSGDQQTALQYLQKADSIYQNHTHEPAHGFSIDYYTAACYRALAADDHDKQKPTKHLPFTINCSNWFPATNVPEYRSISAEKIYLYKLLGRFDEACRIYQELYTVTDTLASKSYIRQINALKATYQIDELKLGNKAQENRIVLASIFIGLGLLAFISMLAVWQRKQKRKWHYPRKIWNSPGGTQRGATRAKVYSCRI